MRWKECKNGQNGWRFGLMPIVEMSFLPFLWLMAMVVEMSVLPLWLETRQAGSHYHWHWLREGMKISYIFVDIFSIYPISVMFDMISIMIDISSIYQFWTDISRKYQICGTCAR